MKIITFECRHVILVYAETYKYNPAPPCKRHGNIWDAMYEIEQRGINPTIIYLE